MQTPAVAQFELLAALPLYVSQAVSAVATQVFGEPDAHVHAPPPPAALLQAFCDPPASAAHADKCVDTHDSSIWTKTAVYVQAAEAAASQAFRLTVASTSAIRAEAEQESSAVAVHDSAMVAANGVYAQPSEEDVHEAWFSDTVPARPTELHPLVASSSY